MYALVVNNTIQSVGRLPDSARRLDTRQWILGLPDAGVSAHVACGYFPVSRNARPVDTPITTWERSFTLVGGVPTETWTERAKNADELAATQASANSDALRAQAEAKLVDNRTFLAIGSPSNAQVLAQVRSLTQQMNGLIRLLTEKLDGTD
jgi:hypothetical protein